MAAPSSNGAANGSVKPKKETKSTVQTEQRIWWMKHSEMINPDLYFAHLEVFQ